MSAPIEPRVRYQAQVFASVYSEWWDIGELANGIEEAKSILSAEKNTKTRILKTTTTFEVVEKMEPKQ